MKVLNGMGIIATSWEFLSSFNTKAEVLIHNFQIESIEREDIAVRTSIRGAKFKSKVTITMYHFKKAGA